MPNESKLIYGSDLMLFASTGSTKLPLAFAQSAQIQSTMDLRNIGSKDSGNWAANKAGKKSWTVSTDGLLAFEPTGSTNSIETLYAIYGSGLYLNVQFAVAGGSSPSWTADTSQTYFSGQALINDISISANDGENSTYSISMTGHEALSITT